MVARTSRHSVVAREESSSPREETFAAAIATPLDAGTSSGEIVLNARDSPSEGVDVDELERGEDRHRARDENAADDVRVLPDWWSVETAIYLAPHRKVLGASVFRTTSNTSTFLALLVLFVWFMYTGIPIHNAVEIAPAPAAATQYRSMIRDDAPSDWIRDEACESEPYSWSCAPESLSWSGTHYLENPCELEVLRNRTILFVGDSYARHAYVAMALWLSGNYKNGALIKGSDKICDYAGQFEEKDCRKQIDYTITTCEGKTKLSLRYGIYPPMSEYSHDWVVLSVGRHPIDGNYSSRLGINDAKLISEKYFRSICSSASREDSCSKLIWLDTHRRLASPRPDEATHRERIFHLEAPLEMYKACGAQMVASAWSASDLLVLNHRTAAANMTHDGAHWGMAINLLKVYSLVNSLRSAKQCV